MIVFHAITKEPLLTLKAEFSTRCVGNWLKSVMNAYCYQEFGNNYETQSLY